PWKLQSRAFFLGDCSMNSDIRLSTTFFSHRKTKKLKRVLGADGIVALISLWARVAIEKPSGVLAGWDDDDIALEADCSGDPAEFVSLLVNIGFIDKDKDGICSLHNWKKRQGWVANSAERSDKARLLRMGHTHKELYKKLVNEGCTGITQTQYYELTKLKRPVNDTLSDTLTPAPAPDPSPDPLPSPSPLPLTTSLPKKELYKGNLSADETPKEEGYHKAYDPEKPFG
ncbi:MAG: hypothetical protein KAV87_34445, partial [Desulfobacteraceae bacterium]|nr:hypothetical protein [Desulfobacteraceae bacterium]